ncbi:MAG: zinc-ribbon domain-containing protein [Siculibacillus sp.]|nr:zinc-ribbon domain-containing protein [Siculibacillus sp.]
MRTTCPTCDTGYTVPDERIGAKGRKVRCTRCGEEWRVFLAAEADADEPPPFLAPPPVDRPAPVADSRADEDPFAALGEVERDPFDDVAVDRPAVEAPVGAVPAPVETADDATPSPSVRAPLPPGRRIHIRTRRHLPRIGKEAVSKFTARLAPAFGPMVFLVACLTLGGVFAFRQVVVGAAPDLAGLYAALGAPVNLRGLDFGRIETLREIDNGQPVLVVEGSIANVSAQMREVPALRFALRGGDTQELYAWSIDPKSTTIESGDTIRFRTRLAAPPDQATEVQVRFVERRSQHAGLP